jgi:hypothetical protein
MTLYLDLSVEDMRLLRRTAARQSGGFVGMARTILFNARERRDGSAWAELHGPRLVQRFIRQRETGSGGWQTYLRKLSAQLEANGKILTEWPEIVRRVEQTAPPRGHQLRLFELLSAT